MTDRLERPSLTMHERWERRGRYFYVAGVLTGLWLGWKLFYTSTSSIKSASVTSSSSFSFSWPLVGLVCLAACGLFVYGNRAHLKVGSKHNTGFAGQWEIFRTLSIWAARKSAKHTRPSLTWWERMRAPVRLVGSEIGRLGPFGLRRVVVPFGMVEGHIGPSQSGKTTRGTANAAVTAPAALAAFSTKVDLFDYSVRARASLGRPIEVWNPDGIGDIESTFAWDPLDGCKDPAVAMLRAGYLVMGAGVGTKDAENGDHFRKAARKAIRCFLLAAALDGQDMRSVERWASDLGDKEPLDILEKHGAPSNWIRDARQTIGTTERTRSSIEGTTSQVLEFMADERIAAAVCPVEGQRKFSVRRFLREQGTLYVLSSHREELALGALMTAFAGYFYDTAKLVASENRRGRRLDPPLTCVFDEAVNTFRVRLPKWSQEASGQGIRLVYAVQDQSQVIEAYGPNGAASLWGNTKAKNFYPGIHDPETLKLADQLLGTREKHTESHSHGEQGRSTQRGTRETSVMDSADIRCIDDGRKLVVVGRSRAVLVRTTLYAALPMYKATKNDPIPMLTQPVAPPPVVPGGDGAQIVEFPTQRTAQVGEVASGG